MKSFYGVAMALLLAASIAGCDKAEQKISVSGGVVNDLLADAGKQGISISSEALRAALDKPGCNIVFANGTGGSDPHVIVAGDTTPANDAARYYTELEEKDRKAVEAVVYQRAWTSFICIGAKQAACSKYVRITYGSGHLPRLGKDVYTIQSERSCQFAG